MSPLFTYNGKLLVKDGKLASNQNCCCGGLQCVCGSVGVQFIQQDGLVLPGAFDTEEEAMAALAEYKSAVGMGRGGGDGMTFDNAVAALQGYGCGEIVVSQGDVVPDFYYGTEGWIVLSPTIIVRCCGQYMPEGSAYDETGALKPGAIDTYPWTIDGAGSVLFPCVDDGSNVICAESAGIPSGCLKGPCQNPGVFCEVGCCCQEGGCILYTGSGSQPVVDSNGVTVFLSTLCDRCIPLYECVGGSMDGTLVSNCADCPADTSYCGNRLEGEGAVAGYDGLCGTWYAECPVENPVIGECDQCENPNNPYTCSLGFGTWDPICADNECCDSGNCVPSAGFLPDVADCVCYTLAQMGQPMDGAYATYSECCAENFCPEPPP